MNGSVYVGQKALSLTEYEKTAPISGVILWVDDENCYEAGDETGTVIEQDCPYASQSMADNLLATLQGYSYQGLEANGAKVSPTAELGDGLTVDGLYTQLAYQNIRFSTGEVMDVAAPGSDETLHEYKTEGQTTKQFTHQIAETKSLISKTSEEILLQVENELKGLSSSFSVQLQQIQSQVTGLNGQVSSITQKVDNITLSVSNGSTSSSISLSVGGVTVSSQTIQMNGLVTFTGLANGTTTIDGACIKTGTIEASRIDTDSLYVNAANITGSLTIGQLPNNVATTGDIPDRVSELENDEGYQTERGVVEIIDGTVTADYVNALRITARTLQGREVELLDSGGRKVGAMDIVNTNTGDGLTIGTNRGGIRIETGQSGNIYISSGHGPFLMLGYGDTGSTAMCQLGGGPLVIPGASYGNRAPSGSGEYGEVYFQLE